MFGHLLMHSHSHSLTHTHCVAGGGGCVARDAAREPRGAGGAAGGAERPAHPRDAEPRAGAGHTKRNLLHACSKLTA